MKHYKEEEVTKTFTEKSVVKTTCDLCGTEVLGDSWDEGCYDVNNPEVEMTVYHKKGTEYPDGGSGEIFHTDICPKCFKTKLVPWLQSQGCESQYVDYDY